MRGEERGGFHFLTTRTARDLANLGQQLAIVASGKKIRKKEKKKEKKGEKEKLFEYHEMNEPSCATNFGVQYNITRLPRLKTGRERRRSGFLRFIWVTVITGGKTVTEKGN